MPELKLYSVAQLRDWLEHNIAVDGLTNEVIRPALAWAIIHNPFVQDEDPIVAAIYDDGDIAASTCAYPEILEKPQVVDKFGQKQRIWWFPTLWVKPEYRGKAYGLIVVGSLAEIYGEENSWTAWAVPETIEIFEHLGLKTYYCTRYIYGNKVINKRTLKGQLAAYRQKLQIWQQSKNKPALPRLDYELRYLTHIDDASYQFICEHSNGHFLHSSQAKLNWDLHYPWTISSPIVNRVHKDGKYFADIIPDVQNYLVQVWTNDDLVGVYILRKYADALSINTLYYNTVYAEMVYASVVEHIQYMQATHFETEDEKLAYYVGQYVYFQRFKEEPVSLNISSRIRVTEKIIR